MKHLRILAIAATAMMASSTWASAQEAYTTGDVNMRAGPGSRYPVVTTIPENREVFIHGCLSNWDWCDVSWRRNRGWVFSDYLEALWRSRRVAFDEYRSFVEIPFVRFGVGYWDRYYRDRPWYDDWDHFSVNINIGDDNDRRGQRDPDRRQRPRNQSFEAEQNVDQNDVVDEAPQPRRRTLECDPQDPACADNAVRGNDNQDRRNNRRGMNQQEP